MLITQDLNAILLIKSEIQKDFSFNYESIKVVNDILNNSLYITVEDRYDTIIIEILPEKLIYIGNKIYNYDTNDDIGRIFKTG